MLKAQKYASCMPCMKLQERNQGGRTRPPWFKTLTLSLLLILGGVFSNARSQGVLSNEQIFSYKAPDRSAWLMERAKREGALTLYTSLAPSEAAPLIKEFERKYGVHVDIWRGLSEGVLQRVLNEGRAKRFSADVVETNGPEMEILAKERMFLEFFSPHQADLPPAMIPKHRLWMPDRLNFFVVAYNTQKIRKEELPNFGQTARRCLDEKCAPSIQCPALCRLSLVA